MALHLVSLVVSALVISGALTQQLYFTDYGYDKLYRMDLTLRNQESISLDLNQPSAMAVDPSSDTIFIANTHLGHFNKTKYILKYHTNSFSTERLDLPRSFRIYGMALDLISNLIFYAEASTGSIRVLNTDFSHSSIIIGGLFFPSDVTLDPVKREMFWTVRASDFPHIGRANMDGTERRNIVIHGVTDPFAVTLDRQENRLYWCDFGLDTIDSCKTDGSNRQVIVRLSVAEKYHSPVSVAVDQTFIYWLQLYKGIIYRTQKRFVSNRDTIGPSYRDNTTNYRSLSLTSTQTISGSNLCSGSNRGGCQHVCIPTQQSRVCRCSDGHKLQSDGMSCKQSSFQRGLFLTDVSTREIINIDLDEDTTKVNTITWYESPRGIAYHPETKQIFWVDSLRRAVFKNCLPTPCFRIVKRYTDPEIDLSFLAIDDRDHMLYLTDIGLDRIMRLSFSGTTEEIIITSLTAELKHIALDTLNRKMYWDEYFGSTTTIKRADMNNGRNQEDFVNGISTVGGLAVDARGQKLYWTDYSNNNVESISLDGRDREVLFSSGGRKTFYGLALGDAMLYFSDHKQLSVYELNIATKSIKEYAKYRTERALSITYYNLGTVKDPTTPSPSGGTTTKPVDPVGPVDPVTTPAASGSGLDQTLIIILSVSIGGVVIIILVIICGVIAYRKIIGSMAAQTHPHPAPAPSPPAPKPTPQTAQQVAGGKDDGTYAELYEKPNLVPHDDTNRRDVRPPMQLPQ